MGDPLIRIKPLPSRACATAVAVCNVKYGITKLGVRCAIVCPSQRTFFFPKVCTALVEAIFSQVDLACLNCPRRGVNQRNLVKRKVDVIQKALTASTACMTTEQYRCRMIVCRRLGMEFKTKIWMKFTYLEVVDVLGVSLMGI